MCHLYVRSEHKVIHLIIGYRVGGGLRLSYYVILLARQFKNEIFDCLARFDYKLMPADRQALVNIKTANTCSIIFLFYWYCLNCRYCLRFFFTEFLIYQFLEFLQILFYFWVNHLFIFEGRLYHPE